MSGGDGSFGGNQTDANTSQNQAQINNTIPGQFSNVVDQNGNVIRHIDDNSNAVFNYDENGNLAFVGWDPSQNGQNVINPATIADLNKQMLQVVTIRPTPADAVVVTAIEIVDDFLTYQKGLIGGLLTTSTSQGIKTAFKTAADLPVLKQLSLVTSVIVGLNDIVEGIANDNNGKILSGVATLGFAALEIALPEVAIPGAIIVTTIGVLTK